MLIRGFSNTELKEVLDELYLDDAVDIVEEMPRRGQAHFEARRPTLPARASRDPEISRGILLALMTTEFVDLRDMTVEGRLKRIRRTGTDKETINVCCCGGPCA